MSNSVATRLRSAFVSALANLDVQRATEASLPEVPGEGSVLVLAVGKCAVPMARAALQRWPRAIDRLVLAHPSRARSLDPGEHAAIERTGVHVEVFATAHPVPDAQSFAAGRRVVELLSRRGNHDVWVMLSGGSSASLCVPREGTDDAYAEAIRSLLASGRDIVSVNRERAALDVLKGGGLARLAAPSTVHTRIVADVLGDRTVVASAVGSGPTWRAQSDDDLAIVMAPLDARRAMATALGTRGFVARDGGEIVASVDALASRLVAEMSQLETDEAVVYSAEPTVALPPSSGRGGRAGRVALLAASALAGTPYALLAGATDGVDGESGAAGAVIDGETSVACQRLGLDMQNVLERFDDATAHATMGTALRVSPTGINLVDLYVVAR